ncbi:MAG: metalloregulator ArsR/SmtB family transcription factor [Lachnospiraceae bacterium]|nr:metalloregulator ArsR/SmtB family transcription factor [Lachnospiraceae bacterium]
MGKKKEKEKKNKKKNADASLKKQKNKKSSKQQQATLKSCSQKINAQKDDILKSNAPNAPEKSRKQSITDTAKCNSPEAAMQMLPVFQALSDENRLKIMNLLSVHERTTPELLELVDVVQSTMSHHLKILTEAGLISCRKQGKRSCYSIRPDTFAQIETYFACRISSAADTEEL